jgi:putative endonuclease
MKNNHYSKKMLGDFGERLAADHLKKAGLKLIKRNYRCPKGEIDLIMIDGEVTVFAEVRTRASKFRGYAEESIDLKKMDKLRSIAAYYLLEQGFVEWPPVRFDVVAIDWEGNEPLLRWIKSAL